MNLVVKYRYGENEFRYMTFKSTSAELDPSNLSDFANWANKKGVEVLSVRRSDGSEETSGYGIPWSSAQWKELKKADEKAIERAETEANKKSLEASGYGIQKVPGVSSTFREEFLGVKIYWQDYGREGPQAYFHIWWERLSLHGDDEKSTVRRARNVIKSLLGTGGRNGR